LLLVEPKPKVPVAARLPKPEPIHKGPRGMIAYVKAMAQTMMEAHDRLYVESADFARTIPIPTLGVGTTAFDLPAERKLALYDSGRWAAEEFLKTWDFDAYIAAYRSGHEHTRRQAVVTSMAAAAEQAGAV
jgi:NTE family protein